MAGDKVTSGGKAITLVVLRALRDADLALVIDLLVVGRATTRERVQ